MRHILTKAEKVSGLKKAIASPRTPKHLRVYLRAHLRKLEGRGQGRRGKPTSFLGWLSL